METLKFKTSINCSGCVARVTPILNKTFGEHNWTVDVNTTEKLLTVTSDSAAAKDVISTLKKVGFTAEEMQ